jgi:hypothetical protein
LQLHLLSKTALTLNPLPCSDVRLRQLHLFCHCGKEVVMIRLLSLRLQAAAATGAPAVAASGRVIAIRKKGKWIDRRSKKIPHNGKDVFQIGEQPSCALCQVRFRYKQDYQAHKDSELHQNRVRWEETQTWWNETGAPAYHAMEEASWRWFEEKVLPVKAAEGGLTLDAAKRVFRKAVLRDTPRDHRMLQAPKVKEEIKEPRDQRWPASPKW